MSSSNPGRPPRTRWRHRFAALTATAALSLTGMAALAAPAHAAPSGVTTAYITDYYNGNVSVADTATGTVTATIPVGGFPAAVAVNPAGTRAYAVSQITNVVSVIDTATATVTATIPVGANPFAISLNPAGTLAYVANETGNSVSVIDTGTNTVVATIPVSGYLLSITLNPAGTRAYVGTFSPPALTVIDTGTNTVVATVPVVGTGAYAVTVNPAGTRVYIGAPNASGPVIQGTVTVVDAATNTVSGSIPDPDATSLAFTPDGSKLYAASPQPHHVTVIDPMSDTVTATITGFSDPQTIAINSTGDTAYVTDQIDPSGSVPGTLWAIDVATNTLSANTTGIAGGPHGLALHTAPAPTVTSVSPSSGPLAAGTPVTITGTNLSGATAITFGADGPATGVSCTATSCTATAPAGAAGTVDVTVTGPGGASATSPADQYTYVAAPTVTGVSPNNGPETGGTTVTITGTGLAGATAVMFGGTAATGVSCTATTCTATAAAHTDGTVDVQVTTVGGTSALSAADQYTYNEPAAVITAISPASGPEAGGTIVTVTGTDFLGATAVHFGTTAATAFTVNSDTQITATAPASTDGTVDVTVTTAAGTSPPVTADHYTYLEPAPAITGIAPTVGDATGGTTVTITGTDFLGATAVHFGTTAATAFTVNSDTQITATAPAGTLGAVVDVTVTAPAGTSATTSADKYSYVNTVAKVTAEGRLNVGGHDAEFAFAARRTAPGGTIKGHLNYDNDNGAGVKIDHATITVFYLTSPTTAHAEGTAQCKIGGTTSTCSFTVNATDNGDPAEHDDGGTHPDAFTLTYNTTTVGGTIEDGHVEIAPETGGSGNSATTTGTPAAAHQLRPAANTAPIVDASPVTAAMTGGFSASLLGISLSGGRCASSALIYTDGTAAGDVNCLLLGVLGINVDVNLHLATGTLGTGNSSATVTGTATVTIAGLLPVTLPATEVLSANGTTGLQLTVGAVTLPALPIANGAIEIG